MPKDPPEFHPGRTQEEEELSAPPAGPLATYAHGYSYSKKEYPGGRPKYFDGDEIRPAGLAPWLQAEIQKALVTAGLLDNPRFGVWDADTQNAYKQILHEANSAGIDAETLLNRYQFAAAVGEGETAARDGGAGGEGRGGHWEVGEDGEPHWVEDKFVAPPLEAKITSKRELKAYFRKASMELTGQALSEEELSELADAYNWRELQVQNEAYEQRIGALEDEFYGRPSDVEQITEVSVESPEAFLEEEVRERHPGEFKAARLGEDYMPALISALGGYAG